ncbi:peptidase inhibitor family I36 protein [Streptomyces achromogenes]|uniref:peptidase inhibitor family I36 protein n=1 Tax=Streptomyces achromogenes TaxID=67255 RepID=UPI0036F6000B
MFRAVLIRGRLLAAAAGAGAIVAAVTAPATAQPAPASAAACEFSGALCLFEGTDYTGERFTVQSLEPGVAVCVDLAEHGWAGRAHSAVNNNSRSATLFTGAGCTGSGLSVTGSLPSFDFPALSVRVY